MYVLNVFKAGLYRMKYRIKVSKFSSLNNIHIIILHYRVTILFINIPLHNTEYNFKYINFISYKFPYHLDVILLWVPPSSEREGSQIFRAGG